MCLVQATVLCAAISTVLSAPTISSSTPTQTVTPSTCDYTLNQCLEEYNDYQCYQFQDFIFGGLHTRACGDVCRLASSKHNQAECERYCGGFKSQNISCDQIPTTTTTITSTTAPTSTSTTTTDTPPTTTEALGETPDLLPTNEMSSPEPNWRLLSILFIAICCPLLLVSVVMNVVQCIQKEKYQRVKANEEIHQL